MERLEPKTIQAKVYADPELRKQAHQAWAEQEARRAAAAEAEAEREKSRPERLEAFWREIGLPDFSPRARAERERAEERKRLLAMPAAEAWMKTHPVEINAANCPDLAALTAHTQAERRRLKQLRRIFKEIGIK